MNWQPTRILLGCVVFNNRDMDAQAEASFKAGIREVVEWIEANTCNAYGEGGRHYCPNCDHQIHGVPDYLWQAKPKEWGIEGGNDPAPQGGKEAYDS